MSSAKRIRIVLTGAPSSGKTECLRRLSQDPALSGFCFLPEQARRILTESPELRHDRSALHREVYKRQTAAESEAGEASFITDRGTVDAYAFHPEHLVEVGTSLEREYARYDRVILLVSSANLGEEYFVTDEVRQESLAEVLEIEAAHRKAWRKHPGYVEISADRSFEAKYRACLDLVHRIIFVSKT